METYIDPDFLSRVIGKTIKITLTYGCFQGVLNHVDPGRTILVSKVKDLSTGKTLPGTQLFFGQEILNVELHKDLDCDQETKGQTTEEREHSPSEECLKNGENVDVETSEILSTVPQEISVNVLQFIKRAAVTQTVKLMACEEDLQPSPTRLFLVCVCCMEEEGCTSSSDILHLIGSAYSLLPNTLRVVLDTEFINKWNIILDTCSFALIELLIEFKQKQRKELLEEMKAIQERLKAMQKDPEFKLYDKNFEKSMIAFRQELWEFKSRKMNRDKHDYDHHNVYRWDTMDNFGRESKKGGRRWFKNLNKKTKQVTFSDTEYEVESSEGETNIEDEEPTVLQAAFEGSKETQSKNGQSRTQNPGRKKHTEEKGGKEEKLKYKKQDKKKKEQQRVYVQRETEIATFTITGEGLTFSEECSVIDLQELLDTRTGENLIKERDLDFSKFRKRSNFYPVNSRTHPVETFQKVVERQLRELSEKTKKCKHNMTLKEKEALNNISSDDRIIVRPSDMGGNVVILNRSDYIAEAKRQFQDMDDEEVKFIVVDQFQPLFGSAIRHIQNQSVLGLGAAGMNLCRHGKLCWLQVATRNCIYLFDILVLGPKAFKNGLQMVLENKHILKVIHDCRRMADFLSHQYRVALNNVFDTQVGDVYLFSVETGGFLPSCTSTLEECLRHHLNMPPSRLSFLTHIQKLVKENNKVWFERPLSQPLLKVLALEVLHLLPLRLVMLDAMMFDFTSLVDGYLNTYRQRTMELLGSTELSSSELPEELQRLSVLQQMKREKALKEYEINSKGFLIRGKTNTDSQKTETFRVQMFLPSDKEPAVNINGRNEPQIPQVEKKECELFVSEEEEVKQLIDSTLNISEKPLHQNLIAAS
ncbi:piRNA biogenesis protein EXD1 [Bombina bombina]|uniref:piRNA biogenesis protein EXD1 n=1 Tax=Bombina bombina TaxID=8345 RepID=UPI00235AFFD7|nr:piRNA biogenesis protein EXD1 [Bombina bombina]